MRLLRKMLLRDSAHGLLLPPWSVAKELLMGAYWPLVPSRGPVRMLPSKRTLLPSFISQKDLVCPEPVDHMERLLKVFRVTVMLLMRGAVRHPASPGEAGFSFGPGHIVPLPLQSQVHVTAPAPEFTLVSLPTPYGTRPPQLPLQRFRAASLPL